MDEAQIKDIILELSLASALPLNIHGRNFIRAAAAANILSHHTQTLPATELKKFSFAVGPLLTLLSMDIDNPVAAKAAYGLRSLLNSRVNLGRFLDLDGLDVIANILNTLMGRKMIDLKVESTHRTIVDHALTIYREVAFVYPWKVVNVGALRHLVLVLEFGDLSLVSVAASTLGMCSKNLQIVEQMFAYGCIKPIINICDFDNTNSACSLSALGCIIQLCKVPEIGLLVAKQGAFENLQKCLLKRDGFNNQSIREKSLYAIAWLSRITEVKPMIGNNETMMAGIKYELETGTDPSKYTIVQILLNLHGNYDNEDEFVLSVREIVLNLMSEGLWHVRNLCIKALIVLYKSNDNKYYFAKNGALDTILELVSSKSPDLYEVPLVGLLSLMIHPDIPPLFLEIDGAFKIGNLLHVENLIIRDIAIILLKVFALYDLEMVQKAVPYGKEHLMQKDEDIPTLYGGEYGGLIETYLQRIVENRRDQHYLLDQLNPDDYDTLGASEDEIESYENTFMELDFNCLGELGLDEMKMLMVMMGEEFDEVELKEILMRWDADGSGALDFREFVLMMQGWTTQFGTGMEKMYNEAFQRGAVGKARRDFNKWWNKSAIEAEQIEAIKEKKRAEEEERKQLAAEHWGHEKLRLERERQEKLRDKKKKEQSEEYESSEYYDSENEVISESEVMSEDQVA